MVLYFQRAAGNDGELIRRGSLQPVGAASPANIQTATWATVARRMGAKEGVTTWAAKAALGRPSLEALLRAGCRRPLLRRGLKLGAVALAYMRACRGAEIRIADLEGYRMFVNVAEPLGIHPFFFAEPLTSWVAERLVSPGSICVDAGANAGHHAFSFAHRAGPRGQVVAFEPNPFFVDLLQRSVALNRFEDRVSIDRRALWSRSAETLELFISQDSANTTCSSRPGSNRRDRRRSPRSSRSAFSGTLAYSRSGEA